MYVNEDIPASYKYLAEIRENYIVLVSQSKLNNGTDYNAYIQFLKPSTEYLYITNYRIKTGDTYNLDYNYSSSGYGSYLDSADVNYSLQTIDISDYISQDFWSRHDYYETFSVGLMITLLACFVINLCSCLVKRGGIFFGA